jgi:hypothetical protein
MLYIMQILLDMVYVYLDLFIVNVVKVALNMVTTSLDMITVPIDKVSLSKHDNILTKYGKTIPTCDTISPGYTKCLTSYGKMLSERASGPHDTVKFQYTW